MKFIKLLTVGLALASLVVLAFSAVTDLSIDGTKVSEPPHSEQLHGKWLLSHYEVLGEKYMPEEVEKNDFIDFHADNTYTSESNGVPENGNYKVGGSIIEMTSSTSEGELILQIKALTSSQLAVVIDDPSDPDAKYLTIHFKR